LDKAIYTAHSVELGQKIVALRKAAGLTQRQLAKKLRRVPSVIAHIERGQRRVDLYELFQIARACGASPKKVAADLMVTFEKLEKSKK
jgi:transcriptional regulator with XRE-family HTH domain